MLGIGFGLLLSGIGTIKSIKKINTILQTIYDIKWKGIFQW